MQCEHTFVKASERIEAIRLRQECGMSIKSIAATLNVSPGSASRWLRHVALTPAQEAALRAANPALNGQCRGAAQTKASARAARVLAQAHGHELASSGDHLHQLGCMLYWAEGSKSRNHVIFTNSDADMVALFLRFLGECYSVPEDRLTLSINVHLGNGLSLEEIQAWWLTRLSLPTACLRRAVVNRASRASLGKRPPLVYGTARLAHGSTFVVQSIYGAIQAYAGVERSRWLD